MAQTTSAVDILDSETVDKLLQWKELIPALEVAMTNFSNGAVVQPVRITVPIEKHNGIMMLMPCYTKHEDILATKIFTAYENNADKGLPIHQGLVFLFDAETGVQKAIMDAEHITAKRTAAATAVAIKAVVAKEPRILAILGAGVQAKSHFEVLTYLYKFNKIRIWNRTRENAEKLVAEIKANGYEAEVSTTAEEATKNADLIVTTTASHTPILKANWVTPGAVVAVIGANRPTQQEVDPVLMKISAVYVDSIEAALRESGDIILNDVKIAGEIGELLSGKKKVPRDKTVIIKTLGMAVEDAVSAKLVYDNFLKMKNDEEQSYYN
uniref:Ketimine reductase mu-crystallin n=1 Tax=Strigamia maritima TaxID=126957 RepID=T1IW72_STRMM